MLPRILSSSFAVLCLTGALAAQIPLARLPVVTATPAFPGGRAIAYGCDLAEIGFVNADAAPDYAVADAGYHGSQFVAALLNIGAVHVFSGAGIPAMRLYSVFGGARTDYFGCSLAALDDLNGDGANEWAAGAHQVGNGTGYVQVRDGATGNIRLTTTGAAQSWFGLGLAAVPDLDGDGFRDLAVVSLQGLHLRSSMTGAAIGSMTLPVGSTGALSIVQPAAVAVVGDTDGDGFADLVVGAAFADTAIVVSGNPGLGMPVLGLLGGPGGSAYGFAVAGVPDSDGDGLDDFAVGAPQGGLVELRSGSAAGGFALLAATAGPAGSGHGAALARLSAIPGAPGGFLAGAPGGPGAGGAPGTVSRRGGPAAAALFALGSPLAPAPGFGSRVLEGRSGNADAIPELAVARGGAGFGAGAGPGAGDVWVIAGAPPASVVSAGQGCGAPGSAILTPVGLPVAGNGAFGCLVTSFVWPNSFGVLAIGFPGGSIPIAPGCTVWMNPAQPIFTLAAPLAGSSAFFAFPLPASAAYMGLQLRLQGAVVNAAAAIFLSDGLEATIGY